MKEIRVLVIVGVFTAIIGIVGQCMGSQATPATSVYVALEKCAEQQHSFLCR